MLCLQESLDKFWLHGAGHCHGERLGFAVVHLGLRQGTEYHPYFVLQLRFHLSFLLMTLTHAISLPTS